MPPRPRRSTRNRPAPPARYLAAAADDRAADAEPAAARPRKRARLTSSPPPPPHGKGTAAAASSASASASAAPSHPPGPSSFSSTSAPHLPERPPPTAAAATTVAGYTANKQTLFLAADLVSFYWTPSRHKLGVQSVHLDLLCKRHARDVHAFFVLPTTAAAAASSAGPLAVYRHVGHVVLPKFQQRAGLSAARRWFPAVQARANAAGAKANGAKAKAKAKTNGATTNGAKAKAGRRLPGAHVDPEFENMAEPLKECWAEGVPQLLDALISLSSPAPPGRRTSGNAVPWKSPFIVALARRDHIVRACDLDNFDEDHDLRVDIFVGRLLFELIACEDIHTLFSHLVPSVPVKPLPVMPTHPATFTRSPPDAPDEAAASENEGEDDAEDSDSIFSDDDGVPGNNERTPSSSSSKSAFLANILRDSESTGYATLSPAHRAKIDAGLTVSLYPYQQQTVRWMLDKEDDPHSLNDYFWQVFSFTDTPTSAGGNFYYFPLKGELRLYCPPVMRGGMVTEEMGLGKTVEALAVILAQRDTTRTPFELTLSHPRKPPNVAVSATNTIQLSRLHVKNQERTSGEQPVGAPVFHHGDEIISQPSGWTDVRIRRWPTSTTLVLCPITLLSQWRDEAHERAPELKVCVWSTVKNGSEKPPLSALVGPDAVDIVLATYDMVRTEPMLSKVHWRRVILDEAQVTRRSSTQVARDVFNLRCGARFLMTGTPLVKSIDDLKGQLATLKVWPFTLEKDGFWETYVSSRHTRDSTLIRTLLDVTMIRHSKAQNLDICMPPRSYETIKVTLSGSSRALYLFLLASCLEDVETQANTVEQVARTNRRELARNRMDTRRLRVLFKQLVLSCLHHELFDAHAIDMVRRQTLALHCQPHRVIKNDTGFQEMTPQEAIMYVAESGAAIMRDSNRLVSAVASTVGSSRGGLVPALAANVVIEAEAAAWRELSATEMSVLRERAVQEGGLLRRRAENASRARLEVVVMGGVHRLATDDTMDLRERAMQLGVGDEAEIAKWTRGKAMAVLKVYYDWERGLTAKRNVPESGFAAIMAMEEGREMPTCPICLSVCDGRLVITKCGHVYCMDCMVMIFYRQNGAAQCSICRRHLLPHRPVEVIRSRKADDKAGGDAGAGDLKDAEEDGVLDWDAPSACQVLREMHKTTVPPGFGKFGQNALFPTLPRRVMQHLMAARAHESSPKLDALLNIISESEPDVKFCVVAGSIKSLRTIASFLEMNDIQCVGAGAPPKRCRDRGAASDGNGDGNESAKERFERDEKVRVYLLNPSSAAGLTLTRASVVVFMEVLVRLADEVQAAARVHRIGQTRPVRIVRIVAACTLEEKITDARGDIGSARDEAKALAGVVSDGEASDRLLVRLFGKSMVRSSGGVQSDTRLFGRRRRVLA